MKYHILNDLICSNSFWNDNTVFWQVRLGLVKHTYFMFWRKHLHSNGEISMTEWAVQEQDVVHLSKLILNCSSYNMKQSHTPLSWEFKQGPL